MIKRNFSDFARQQFNARFTLDAPENSPTTN
jgi:hypothetical protein